MLVPCPGCARHVRSTDPTCPFCKQAMPSTAAGVPATNKRLTRAAIYAFTATLATAGAAVVAGCDGETVEQDDGGTPAPVYGAPATDAGTDVDNGGVAPAYGAPDPGTDGGTAGALYGGPPLDGG